MQNKQKIWKKTEKRTKIKGELYALASNVCGHVSYGVGEMQNFVT